MAKETKLFDCSNTATPLSCLTLDDLMKEGWDIQRVPPSSGVYQTPPQSAGVEFKRCRNAKEIRKGNAYIVLGADRPTSLVSGFGAKGSQKAATIDLVVGRMASVNEGAGAPPTAKVDNSFVSDAARIYISQLTNIDANFGLAGGEEGSISQKACSAIGLKADGIRIIGRQGIKIVTGKAQGATAGTDGELNAQGGKITTPAPAIELIAGNNISSTTIPGGKYLPGGNVEKLQPIPLGTNTRDALQELSDIVGELWAAVFNFALIQSGQNIAFGTSPFAWQPAAVAAATPMHLSYVINSLYQTRVNNTLWQLNYLNPLGYKYICSPSVKTT